MYTMGAQRRSTQAVWWQRGYSNLLERAEQLVELTHSADRPSRKLGPVATPATQTESEPRADFQPWVRVLGPFSALQMGFRKGGQRSHLDTLWQHTISGRFARSL